MTFAAGAAVLGDLAALGPFFAVDAHPPGEQPYPPWHPVAELMTPSEVLRGRIGAVRRALAEQTGEDAEEIELRVAASIAHLGLVARLAAPAIAVTPAGHHLDLGPGGLWWQDVIGGPMPLSVPAPMPAPLSEPVPASASGPAGHGTAAADRLIDDVVAPLTAAVGELVPISPRVLWGNVASAVNGAAAQIARQRPDSARHAWLTVAALFRHPALGRERVPPGPGFRRSSCCLRYRLMPGADGLCGDCVLVGAAGHRRMRPPVTKATSNE
jgi:hypothetical protein